MTPPIIMTVYQQWLRPHLLRKLPSLLLTRPRAGCSLADLSLTRRTHSLADISQAHIC